MTDISKTFEQLASLPDEALVPAVEEIKRIVEQYAGGGGGDAGGVTVPGPDDHVAAVNAKAAEILALSGAQLTDEDRQALVAAGATSVTGEQYLAQVQKIAQQAARRGPQSKLMQQYKAEIVSAQGTDAKLLVRSKYRRQGLDI